MELQQAATFLRVLLATVLALGVLPRLVLPRPATARSGLDAAVANLLRWLAIVMVVSHVLAGLGIYNRVSLLVVFAVIAWFSTYRRRYGGLGGLLHRLWPTDTGRASGRGPARSRLGWRDRLALAALATPLTLLLAASYWLRAKDTFATVALSPPDAYVHMTWAWSFQQNTLWPDGVYPQGMSAILSLIHLVAPFTEILDVARFTGPMVGTLLVFAIYYAVLRLSRNPGAALFAAGLLGLFGANPEWREPWARQVGLLPQEFGLALALLAMVFAVLAVSEAPHGPRLRLGPLPALPVGGHAATLGAAVFAVALSHPLPGLWAGLVVALAAVGAVLVTHRFAALVGAGLTTLVGAAVGFAVVPVAQWFGVPAYLGYGAGEALADLTGMSFEEREAKLIEYFGELDRLGHNWLSLAAGAAVVLGVVAVVLLARSGRRQRAAELLGLTAVGGFAVAAFDLRPLAGVIDPFYLVRLANLLGPTLPLAFGAGLGGLSLLVARRVTYVRVAVLVLIGLVSLGGIATRFPADAIERWYEREEIEYEEMTHLTLRLKHEVEPLTYTTVGLASQRQVLGEASWFIASWVFARDLADVPHNDILPVPTPETYVFVELDPYPVNEVDPNGAVEEYYFDREKRGRIQARLYEWAELRRRVNPDTTIWYDGEHIRVYRVARNPAIQTDPDRPEFKDYDWDPGELFTTGPTSPRDLEATFDAIPEPVFDELGAP
ncbi:MAG TPA: hypothetical protein VK906_06980 [Egicoccus sp.]|nr:hypothetical protein [Egicoccus sp.]HSK22899.1 hypothetical protein [Egicoccus sp.]